MPRAAPVTMTVFPDNSVPMGALFLSSGRRSMSGRLCICRQLVNRSVPRTARGVKHEFLQGVGRARAVLTAGRGDEGEDQDASASRWASPAVLTIRSTA